MIKAQKHFEHQMENLKRLGNEQSGFFFFSHFGVDTYSLCSMVRDVQQDMLKGPLSANRLNTHITHTPSFLISLFLCVL